MIDFRFFENTTWQGNFTIVVMEGGCPEFNFETSNDVNEWVRVRGGKFASDQWQINRWGNRFIPGTIQAVDPLARVWSLDDLEVIERCKRVWVAAQPVTPPTPAPVAKPATKAELIDRINALTSEYLGFRTGVWGVKGYKRERLDRMAARYEEMVAIKRQSDAIEKASGLDRQGLLAVSLMDNPPAWHTEVWQLRQKATEIWHNWEQ